MSLPVGKRRQRLLTEQAIFLGVVEKVYETALHDDSWSRLLDTMASLFSAVGVSFEVFETATNRPIFIELGSHLALASAQDDVDCYGSISPRVRYDNGKPPGFISYDHMILTESERNRDEFYTDRLGPIGLRFYLAAQVFCSASHQAVFAVQRSPAQGRFGDAEIALLKRLLPHLQQATDLRFRLTAARINSPPDLSGLEKLNEGCLTIDRAGTALSVNSRATEIVSQGDGIGLLKGRLFFADETAARRYSRGLGHLDPVGGKLMTGCSFPVRRPNGKRPYLIAVHSLPQKNEFTPYARPAAAVVFIRDPDRLARLNTRLLRQSYGLTAAESDLAAALDRGLRLQDVAVERHVSITTVRSQLYALMAKMGVNRQTDLIRLLAHYRQPFT